MSSAQPGAVEKPEPSYYPGSPSWTSGEVQLDNNFGKMTIDPKILDQLAQLDVKTRENMMRGTVRANPANPNPWLLKCFANHQNKSRNAAFVLPGGVKPRYVASPQMHGPPCKTARLELSEPTLPTAASSPTSGKSSSSSVVPAVVPSTLAEAPKFYKIPLGCAAHVCMPEWVREALVCIDDPQALLNQVCTKFDVQVSNSLFQQSPRVQVMMIVALLFNAHMWADVNAGMAQLLMLHEGVIGNPEVAIVGLDEVKSIVELIVLHNCSGVGTGFLVLQSALKIMTSQFPCIEFRVIEEHSFEKDPVAMTVQERVADLMGINIEFHKDVHELPELIRVNKQMWTGKKLLMLNSFPCKNTSTANNFKDRPEGSGFHMRHSRAVWPIIEASSEAMPEFGKGGAFHLTEYPPCGNAGEENLMNQHFGQSVKVQTLHYRSAKRDRNIRTDPFNLDLKYFSVPTDPNAPMDGWAWCGNRDARGQTINSLIPEVTLRSHIVKLTHDLMFKPESLGDGELKTLNSIKMSHATTRDERLINRDFWYQWLGMLNTPISKALDELHPCQVWIIKTVGIKSTMENCGESCGTSRWCRQCEQVFEMLGQAWHVPIMVDIAYALLKKISEVLKNPDLMNKCCRSVQKEQVHKCGPSCVHNPAQGL
jgi:hypothetical protein